VAAAGIEHLALEIDLRCRPGDATSGRPLSSSGARSAEVGDPGIIQELQEGAVVDMSRWRRHRQTQMIIGDESVRSTVRQGENSRCATIQEFQGESGRLPRAARSGDRNRASPLDAVLHKQRLEGQPGVDAHRQESRMIAGQHRRHAGIALGVALAGQVRGWAGAGIGQPAHRRLAAKNRTLRRNNLDSTIHFPAVRRSPSPPGCRGAIRDA